MALGKNESQDKEFQYSTDSMGIGNEDMQRFWLKQAERLARRINLAWFLDGFAAPLMLTAALGSVLVLVFRREFPEFHPGMLIGCFGLLLLILAVVVLIRVRKRFEVPRQALVRIEASQGLNSALSAAYQGIVPWPDVPPTLTKSLRWHFPKTLTPPLAALLIMGLGLFIPIKARSSDQSTSLREPIAWSNLDSQLEQLAEDALVDEMYIEDTRKRLNELRAQEEEQWFSHSSLEATDSLMESNRSSVQDLQKNLDEAAESLQNLAEPAEKLGAQEQAKLAEDFQEALEGLKNGPMKPNQQLLDQLSQLNPHDLGKLNSEQLQQLKENMENLQKSLSDACDQPGDDWSDQLLGEGEGEGEGQGNGAGGEGQGSPESGEGPGKGGIQRGPGHDPNVLRGQKDGLDVGDLTAVEAKDLSRSMPGDLLQLQDGTHTADQGASQPFVGGKATKGSGGDRVWRESLAPDEQRALKQYFE